LIFFLSGLAMLIQSFFSIVYTPIAENIPYAIINTPDNMIIFDNNPIYYKMNNQC